MTWGSDYAITLVSVVLGVRELFTLSAAAASPTKRSALFAAEARRLRVLNVTFMFVCALCGFAGGFAHHRLAGDLTALSFRVCWSSCVSLLAICGSVLGLVSSLLTDMGQTYSGISFPLPHFPPVFWYMWGVLHTVIVFLGAFSCQQPAGDMLLSGFSHALPLAALVGALRVGSGAGTVWRRGDRSARMRAPTARFFAFALVLNSPLTVIYPILDQHAVAWGYTIGFIYAVFHAVLIVCIAAQNSAMRSVAADMEADFESEGSKQQ
jgi:hypothetical protein